MAGAAAGLERALLASLALHGAVLAGVSLPEMSPTHDADSPPPIEARIVDPPFAEIQSVTEKATAPKPRPNKNKIAKSKIIPVTAPVAEASPAAVPAPAPQPVALVSDSPDPRSVRDYRAQLLGAAGRFKRYPQEARENNWTGDVVVGVAVRAGGAAQVGLRRSSGHAVLDEQALDMFRQAAREVPVPETLRGREFSLEVRAVYGLED